MTAPPTSARPLFVPVGDNPARAFGMDAAERATALAVKAGMAATAAEASAPGVVLADLDFAWDPVWASHIAQRPGTAMVKDGRVVLAHLRGASDAEPIAAKMRDGVPLGDGHGLEILDA